MWVRVDGEAMFMVGAPSRIGDTLIVQMAVSPTTVPNFTANLGFSVYFDDDRLPLHSASFGVFLPVRARSGGPTPPIIRPLRDPVIVIDNAVREPIENLERIGAGRAVRLAAAGIHTAYDLLGRSPSEIARIAGMTDDEAETTYFSAIERTRRMRGES